MASSRRKTNKPPHPITHHVVDGVLRGKWHYGTPRETPCFFCPECGWIAGEPESQTGGDWNATENPNPLTSYFCRQCGGDVGGVA